MDDARVTTLACALSDDDGEALFKANLDYASQLPDVLDLSPRITCPVLYIRGDKEPAHVYPAEEFAARAGGRCDVHIVKDCDHFYGGREDTISGIVTDWLKDVLAKT